MEGKETGKGKRKGNGKGKGVIVWIHSVKSVNQTDQMAQGNRAFIVVFIHCRFLIQHV